MKKIISVMTLLVIALVSFPSTVFAKEVPNDVISVEEYELKMNEIYQKYNGSYEILDTNGIEFIDKELAEKEYIRIEENLEKIYENERIKFGLTKREIFSPFQSTDATVTRAMPVPYFDSRTYHVTGSGSVLSNATFKFDIEGTVDINLGVFMAVSKADLYQNGMYVNYKSYVEVSNGDYMPSDRKKYNLARELDVTFEYQDPVSNMVIGETVRRYITDTFDAM